MTPTRPLDMNHSYFVFVWLLMLVSFIIFGYGVYSRYKQWKKNMPEDCKNSAGFPWFIRKSFGISAVLVLVILLTGFISLKTELAVLYWSHILVSFVFIAFIPHSKMFHILTGSHNQYLAKDKAGQIIKPLDNVSPWKISWKSRADWDDEF